MLSGMMFSLRKTRLEIHSMAFNINSKNNYRAKLKSLSWKILNYKVYSEILNVLCDQKESLQTMVPSNDPKLGK